MAPGALKTFVVDKGSSPPKNVNKSGKIPKGGGGAHLVHRLHPLITGDYLIQILEQTKGRGDGETHTLLSLVL